MHAVHPGHASIRIWIEESRGQVFILHTNPKPVNSEDTTPMSLYELQPHSIQVLGNIAVVLYSAKWKGNIVSDYGRYMHTWVKQNYKWKFFSGNVQSDIKFSARPSI